MGCGWLEPHHLHCLPSKATKPGVWSWLHATVSCGCSCRLCALVRALPAANWHLSCAAGGCSPTLCRSYAELYVQLLRVQRAGDKLLTLLKPLKQRWVVVVMIE